MQQDPPGSRGRAPAAIRNKIRLRYNQLELGYTSVGSVIIGGFVRGIGVGSRVALCSIVVALGKGDGLGV